ncbi:hypothetical protein MMC22_000404 [Lobaria immixta]|nr:hypothetical protein [Lobaria immixta]
MDRLPVELIRMIFSLLRSTDVGHLRRVSKLFANAGRSRMFRHLHLMFTPHSFERLRAISSNPELAPYVTSIFYEADTLPVYESMEDWEQELIDRKFDWEQHLKDSKFEWEQHLSDSELDSNSESENSSCPSHSSDSSDRAERTYRRELSQLGNLKSSRYQKFVNYSRQQDAMRKDNYYAGKIADAMLHLTNLENI